MSRLCSTTLRIGDPAPPFALFALNEQVVQLAEVLDEVPLVLLFAPGAWSPGARRQIEEFSGAHERLQVAGIGLLAIITEDARSLRRRLVTQMPPFPILADERREAARSYGVFRALSWDGIGVTCPAAFLIDRSGLVRFMYVGQSDRDVPETEALIRLAAGLFGVPVPESVAPIVEAIEAQLELGALEDDSAGRLIGVAEDEAVGVGDSVGYLVAVVDERGFEPGALAKDDLGREIAEELVQGELLAVPALTLTGEPPREDTAPQNGSPALEAEPAAADPLVGATEPPVDREPRVAMAEGGGPEPDREPAKAVSGKPTGTGKAEA